ncbi:MAG: MFS transporter, partial [Pseudomonadales bacterium]|nr:MFS transporter [Pseudomonadales bacterium]
CGPYNAPPASMPVSVPPHSADTSIRSRWTMRADWPFDVRRTPFFYGWVIWLFSTLGFLMSVPGQTMGMAVFTDPFIDAFDLSRTELSFAYLGGTVTSALFLTRAGRLYDRLGARIMVAGSALLLGLLVVFISLVDHIGTALAAVLGLPLAAVTLPAMLIGYFGVRFAGQGVLTSASRNVLLVWFERRRGIVSGARGVFVSLGFSIAPLLLALMIDDFGWRGALWLMAAVLIFGFASLALFFLRDSPASVGLNADGVSDAVRASAPATAESSKTLHQARLSPSFWIYSAGLSIHALFGTAVTFHIVAIFAEAGRDRGEAFGYFLPSAIVSTTVNLLASWLADRSRLKPFLLVMLSAFLLGTTGLLNLDTAWGYALLVFGFGAGGGLWGVISNLAYVRLFGTLHLGEISGLNTALTVMASAIGPFLFSLGFDMSGSFHGAEWLCGGVIVVLLIAAALIRQPDDRAPHLALRAVNSSR